MRIRIRPLRHVARPGRGQEEVEELRVRPLRYGVWQGPRQKEDEAGQEDEEEDAEQEDAGVEPLRSRSSALRLPGPRA